MIAGIIHWSIKNRVLVLLLTFIVSGWGLYAISRMPVDALPDLSDVQVIIKTSYPGQAPQVVEDHVTYPLTTTMLSVPKATVVRGYSFFGRSTGGSGATCRPRGASACFSVPGTPGRC